MHRCMDSVLVRNVRRGVVGCGMVHAHTLTHDIPSHLRRWIDGNLAFVLNLNSACPVYCADS
jgi:hypothetical protein